jgi:hypothetical protein
MRTVSAANLIAATTDGHESLILVEIDTGAGLLTFADRDLDGTDGRIMELGNANMQIAEGAPATAGSISVKFSDEDFYFLSLIGNTRLEGRRARVLQIFDGNVSDPVELMVGRVGSPVVWSEDSRTFELDIVAFYESNSDTEVPFAPDESSGLQEFAWNKPWPRCYGTPVDAPAVLVVDAPKGTLIRELQPTFDHVDIEVADDVEFPLNTEVQVEIGNEYMTGTFTSISTDPTVILRFHIKSRNDSKGIIYSIDRSTLTSIEQDPNNYNTWEADPRYAAWDTQGKIIAGNWLFLLDSSDTLDGGAVSDVNSPSFTHIYGTFSVPSFVGNKNYILYQKGDATRGQFPWIVPSGLYYITIGARADIRGVLDVNETLWPAGTPIRLVTDVVYVANDVPSSSVLQVRAWREVQLDSRGGRARELVVVPADFYTVDLNDTIAGRACTTITLEKPLSARGTGWQDDIFVTLVTTVGPNVSDIISDLMTEAGITVDPTSFLAVKTACANYPMNFSFTSRKDALQVAGDIAFQGRCGLSVLGSTAYLKYLSVAPASIPFTYNEDTVLEGTVQVTSTETTNITNDLWVTWHRRGSQQHPERLHYKDATSVLAYGRKKRDLEIYVYRHKTLVQKTAQFWFYRWSNAWRKLRVIGDLDAIGMTVYDDVKSTLSELVTNAMIEQLEHDTEENQITALLWTPVVVGNTTQSNYAYLDDTGDTAPAALSLSAGDDIAEIIEVSALDLGLSEKQTHVGVATTAETPAGPIGGVFNAKLYKSNNANGEVYETEVKVQNISGTPIQEGDQVVVHKAEDGTFYATKGGSSSSTSSRGGTMVGTMRVDEDGDPTDFDVTPDPNDTRWNTALTVDQESKFQEWKAANAPLDSGADYDYRGAFLAGVTADPNTGHWPDTFKKPNHPTFSNESKYAYLMPHYAGFWTGTNHDVYVSPDRNKDHYVSMSLAEVGSAFSTSAGNRIGRKMGENSVFDGQVLPVYVANDGTAWVLPIDNPFSMGIVATDSANKDSVQIKRYKTDDFSEVTAETVTAKTPRLQSTAKITAGTIVMLTKIGNSWVFYIPLIRPRVPA